MPDDGVRFSGPDRSVPLHCRVQFLFGGFYNQFGWVWLGFTSIHLRLFLSTPEAPWPVVIMILIFPAVGLAFISVGLRKGLKGLRLLRHGMTAEGRFIGKKATNTKINGQTVWELSYEFATASGRQAVAKARSHEPEPLTDQALEPLVYDPLDPLNAVMLDDLPGRPRLDQDSVTRTEAGLRAPLLLVVPGLTLLGHILWTLLAP